MKPMELRLPVVVEVVFVTSVVFVVVASDVLVVEVVISVVDGVGVVVSTAVVVAVVSETAAVTACNMGRENEMLKLVNIRLGNFIHVRKYILIFRIVYNILSLCIMYKI